MKLPFGIGKAFGKSPTPRAEVVHDPTALGEGGPDGSASPGCEEPGRGGSQIGRIVRLGGGPKRWTAWRIAAVAVLVYVAAANLSYFLVLKPVWSRLDGLRDRKTIIEDFFVVRESRAAVTTFRDGLMKGDQRMTVMSELERFAADAGVKIAGEPKLLPESEVSKRMTEYPVEITLNGDYHEIGRFLGLIESSPRFMIVHRATLETNGESGRTEAKIVLGVVSWEE